MMLQPENSSFILAMIKEVEAHKVRSHCTLMKNSEFNKNHKNIDEEIKHILSI